MNFFFSAQRTPSWRIPLGISIYIIHKTGEELLLNFFSHLLINCSCSPVPVNSPLVGKVLLSVVYQMIKSSFYFSWVWAPPCSTAQLSSFSSSLSGIPGSSKLQLVSSCCCLATLFYSHKKFSTSLWCHLHNYVISILLGGHVLERDSSLSHYSHWRHLLFTCHFSFSSCWWGQGWQGTLNVIFVSCCPTTPMYGTFVGVCM